MGIYIPNSRIFNIRTRTNEGNSKNPPQLLDFGLALNRHIRVYSKFRRIEHFQALLPSVGFPAFPAFHIALSRRFVGCFHPKPYVFVFMHRSFGWLLFLAFLYYHNKLSFVANRTTLLGGSWVVKAGVIRPSILWVIAIVTLLISPPMTTDEPPSTFMFTLNFDCQLFAFNSAFLLLVKPKSAAGAFRRKPSKIQGVGAEDQTPTEPGSNKPQTLDRGPSIPPKFLSRDSNLLVQRVVPFYPFCK